VLRRELQCEALTGVRTGQPLSRDRTFVLGADAVQGVEGTHVRARYRKCASARMTRRGRRPWHVRTLFAREPGDLHLDHRRLHGPVARIGKARSQSQ